MLHARLHLEFLRESDSNETVDANQTVRVTHRPDAMLLRDRTEVDRQNGIRRPREEVGKLVRLTESPRHCVALVCIRIDTPVGLSKKKVLSLTRGEQQYSQILLLDANHLHQGRNEIDDKTRPWKGQTLLLDIYMREGHNPSPEEEGTEMLIMQHCVF